MKKKITPSDPITNDQRKRVDVFAFGEVMIWYTFGKFATTAAIVENILFQGGVAFLEAEGSDNSLGYTGGAVRNRGRGSHLRMINCALIANRVSNDIHPSSPGTAHLHATLTILCL